VQARRQINIPTACCWEYDPREIKKFKSTKRAFHSALPLPLTSIKFSSALPTTLCTGMAFIDCNLLTSPTSIIMVLMEYIITHLQSFRINLLKTLARFNSARQVLFVIFLSLLKLGLLT